MKRYFICGVPGVEPGYLVYLYCLTPLGLQTHLCKHSTPGIPPMHLSKHNYGRLQFFVVKTGLEPAIALVIGCVSHTPLDLVTLIQVYD